MAWKWVQSRMTFGLALAGFACRLAAADRPVEVMPVSFRVTRYTAEQGLPQNTVRAMLQTRDGYLWAGTLAGLARFDGVGFDLFDELNTPAMTSDAINSLAEDRQDGSLWINTGNELVRYHEHRFERFAEQDGFPHPFGQMWPAREGGLWYSPHPGGLVRLQHRKVQSWQLRPRRLSTGDEDMTHRIMQVEEESGGSLLLLMSAGLFRFVPSTGSVTPMGPQVLAGDGHHSFFKQADGTLLVAAQRALWLVSGDRWERIESAAPTDRQFPVGIHPSRTGDLWIQWSDTGPPRVARFHAGHSEFLDLTSLPDYPVNEFLEDYEGHLWLATESGLCQLRQAAVQVFAREQGLRNDNVKSVSEGPDGTIWAGTDEGVSGMRDGRVTNLPAVGPGLYYERPKVLLADRRGRVWIGAQLGCMVGFDRGVWGPAVAFGEQLGWIRTLYEDRAGSIWAGCERGVAWMGEDGVAHELPQPAWHPDVRTIHQDRRGDLWFGTYGGGLNRLHEGQIATFKTALGEYNNRAWWIHEDADGVFWVGSQNGLNRFVPPDLTEIRNPKSEIRNGAEGCFFTFTTQHGLRENTINNIQEDDFGNLWLSGLRGIYCIARRELNAVAAGRQPQVQVRAFGEADGMLNSECNGGDDQPSGCKDRAGRIWFTTVRGVVMVDPRTIRRDEVPPPVVIEQVKADGQVVYGDGAEPGPRTTDHGPRAEAQQPSTLNHRLPPGRARVLEIRYTSNSFAAPHRMRFKYRLVGVDPDWQRDDDNRRVAFYTTLWPGSYMFEVMAGSNHGIWSATPAQFAFTLAPHFWQTWWFYALAGVAVIGLAAGIQTYRLRWQRRLLKLAYQRSLAEERTRIARDLHDDLGTALTGLALRLDLLRRDARGLPALTDRLTESAARIRSLAKRMRDVVWAVNPACDTVSSLASFLEEETSHLVETDEVRCRLDFPDNIVPQPLDGETRYQLALAVREALSNAVRHAAAREIVLGLRVEGRRLFVQVSDNGRGFEVAEGQALGRGLTNMQARLQKIGGQCECRSSARVGTTIEFSVPLPPADHPPKPV